MNHSLFNLMKLSTYISVIQVYVPTSNAEEAEAERFYEDLQDVLEHSKKMSLFPRSKTVHFHFFLYCGSLHLLTLEAMSNDF